MKFFITCLFFLLLSSPLWAANVGYVSDQLIVTLREQPADRATTLGTMRTGEKLEIIEDLKEFLHVRTEAGQEGYVRSQYISDELPKTDVIKQLKTEIAAQQEQIDQLTTSLEQQKSGVIQTDEMSKELARVKAQYEALQLDAGNIVQITRERDQLLQENSDLTGRLQILAEQSNINLRTEGIQWFIAGACVLVFGWLLGKLSRPKKRGFM